MNQSFGLIVYLILKANIIFLIAYPLCLKKVVERVIWVFRLRSHVAIKNLSFMLIDVNLLLAAIHLVSLVNLNSTWIIFTGWNSSIKWRCITIYKWLVRCCVRLASLLRVRNLIWIIVDYLIVISLGWVRSWSFWYRQWSWFWILNWATIFFFKKGYFLIIIVSFLFVILIHLFASLRIHEILILLSLAWSKRTGLSWNRDSIRSSLVKT